MRAKLVVLALALMLIATSYGYGQTWDQAKGIGLTGSLVKFAGGDVDRAALGNYGGLSLRWGATPNIMLDLNWNYGSFRPNEAGGSILKAESIASFRTFLMPIALDVRFTPSPEARLKPYVYVGGGALLWDLRDVSKEDLNVFSDQKLRWGTAIYSETKRDAIYKAGVGVETFFADNLSLDLQGGVFGLANSAPADNVGYADENSYAWNGRATLSFYFGFNRDKDKDGIIDRKDADPIRPEDFDGFQDEDGAPDYDNDNDGILDEKDGAPNDPEDKDGYQDEDGVPDLDNDGDGIPDAKDKAPNKAEDVDNFQDDDGAPDPDNDGDGIVDSADKCPGTDVTAAKGINTKENYNGFQDDDGCPDKKPMPKLEKKGAKLILKGVNFETASATLTTESFAILDEIIPGLRDNKDVELEIRGYTDSQGSAAYNQKLSEQRANSVMQYLINNGIEASRLRAVGYGEQDPIASNRTAAGRAQNRRIEFVRTK